MVSGFPLVGGLRKLLVLNGQVFVHLLWVIVFYLILQMVEQQHLWLV